MDIDRETFTSSSTATTSASSKAYDLEQGDLRLGRGDPVVRDSKPLELIQTDCMKKETAAEVDAKISVALNKMKKETAAEVDAKLAEGWKKVEAELQEALVEGRNNVNSEFLPSASSSNSSRFHRRFEAFRASPNSGRFFRRNSGDRVDFSAFI